MKLHVGQYEQAELPQLMDIWNQVVEEGIAFPQDEPIKNVEEMQAFCQAQSFVGCARVGKELVGMYILHPNDIGRKSHVANASYAVKDTFRGAGVGRRLVEHSLHQARQRGFVGMQFNAVVATNEPAKRLYESVGFRKVGTIEEGFAMKDGSLSDMVIYYYHFASHDTAQPESK